MKLGALLVRTRQVPAYAAVQIEAQFPKPAMPKVKVHSVAGHDELKDAPTDSPEWEEYSRQTQARDKQIQQAQSDFMYDYAVEAWSWDDGATWLTEPPDDWTFPEVFKRHGLLPSTNRRVDYIRLELITSNVDVELLFRDALESTEPISNAEVSAASAGFRGETKRGFIAAIKAVWHNRWQRAIQRNVNRA